MDLRSALALAALVVTVVLLVRAASRRLPPAALRPGEPYAEPTPGQRLLAVAVVGGALLGLGGLARRMGEEPLWLMLTILPAGLALAIWWVGFGAESARALRARPRPWALLLAIQAGVVLGLCLQRGAG